MNVYAINPETAVLSVVGGPRSLNRYAHRGGVTLVTGDRPRFRLSRLLPAHQMSADERLLAHGRVRIGPEQDWLDERPGIRADFHPHGTHWRGALAGGEFELWVAQAADWGAVIRVHAPLAMTLVLDSGEADRPGGRIAVDGPRAVIEEAGGALETFVWAGSQTRLCEQEGHLCVEIEPEAPAWIVIGHRAVGTACWPWSPEDGSPTELMAESQAHYAKRLAEVSCRTPSPALDAALATAAVNMEYSFAPPAWREGVEFWSAYWCNNYQIQAALDLGQTERARAALEFTGGRERGPCPTLYADGEPIEKWCGDIKSIMDDEDGLPYWLLQFCRYVEHTGDLAFAERLWPKIERAIAYCWDARDHVGNGLLSWHSGCNTFMYQADALGMPGEATSPSLIMAGMLERLAVLADRLGHAATATAWRQKTKAMYAAMIERLWQSDDGCFCNHRDLQDIVHRAHYYTDLVFPTLYTRLPDAIGRQSLLRAVHELWIPLEAQRALLRVGSLKPASFGNDNPMPTQMAEAARAFFRAGLRERGLALLETVARAATTDTDAPGNFPERVSEAGRGLNHYVFGNPVGSFAIAVVEGLFGLTVEDEGQTLHGRPAFPNAWDTARLRTPYASLEFVRHTDGDESVARYMLTQDASRALQFDAVLPPCRVSAVTIDGRDVEFRCGALLDSTRVTAAAPAAGHHVVNVTYKPCETAVSGPVKAPLGETVHWRFTQEVEQIEDPQGVLQDLEVSGNMLHARLAMAGAHDFFVHYRDVPVVIPVAINVEATTPRETPLIAQARAMLGAPVDVLDLSSLRHAARILCMSQFGNRRCDLERAALSGASPELHTPAGAFPLPECGPLLVELAYGMSEKYSRALRRSDCPHQARIPIRRRIAGLWLLYLCDVEVRQTDCEVGAIVLECGDGSIRRLPLVMGEHIDTALPALPDVHAPERGYATATLPVPLALGGHANLLWVPAPEAACIDACTISIAAADVWFGLLGAALVGQRES